MNVWCNNSIRLAITALKSRIGCVVCLLLFIPQYTLGERAQAVLVEPQNGVPAQIPWSEIGDSAMTHYKGGGLVVVPTGNGASLRCAFQKLEGEATSEGLWLVSTVPDAVKDRVRVVASAVGKVALPRTGALTADEKTVRFIRPNLTEEYSVSMDGVRQDFVVARRPEESAELRVELDLTGARVEKTAYGARLVFDNSGRRIAYSRLRAEDAAGRGLHARVEVASINRIVLAVDDTEAVYPVRIDPTFSDQDWIGMGGIPGADSFVYASAVDGSGNLYIGGYFTVAGENIASRIAKWNGTNWSLLGSGMSGPVFSLAVSGNDLYAAGDFTNAGGIAVKSIAKWDGNSWSALGSGLNGQVYALAVSGSNVYAGGGLSQRPAITRPISLLCGTGVIGRLWDQGWAILSRTFMRSRCPEATFTLAACSQPQAGSQLAGLHAGMGATGRLWVRDLAAPYMRWRFLARTFMRVVISQQASQNGMVLVGLRLSARSVPGCKAQ